jgi:hypothetical protein
MVGQILDKINSWFGQSFLLAQYFPWLLFCLANLLLAAMEFPEVSTFLRTEYNAVASSKLVDLLLALAGIAVLAYTVSPVTRFITKLLRGDDLWRWIAEPLLLRHVQERDNFARRRQELFLKRAALPKIDDIVKRLARMKEAGAAHGKVTDRDSIAKAEKAIVALRAKRYLNRTIEASEFIAAVQTLSDALQRNCSDLIELRPPLEEELPDAAKLDGLHDEMVDELAPYAIDIAEQREAHVLAVQEGLFGDAELAPTRLGNDVAAVRSYCLTRYGIEFDFFWPRLELTMKNDKLSAALTTARIQFDFSVLSLTLTVVFTVAWLAILGRYGQSLVTLLLVVAVGPLAAAIWLWIVHASYSAYAELVRSTIDLCRFDLLQALRLPLPSNAEAEMKTWQAIARLLVLNDHGAGLAFRHPGS